MRVVIATYHLRVVAGIESYLATVIPELMRAGCAVAMLAEVDVGVSAGHVAPAGIPAWCVSEIGLSRAIDALRAWEPEVVFVNGHLDVATQAALQEAAPALFYAHGYYGTCVSGAKSFKFPVVRPCHRRFGAACLLHYLPHRCGGLNPLTMVRRYREAVEQARLMRRYRAILTVSDYVRREYVEHGFVEPQRVITLPCPVRPAPPTARNGAASAQNTGAARLLFAGRMTVIKGGQLMIEAMAPVARALGHPLELTLAGDGPERRRWERMAARVMASNPGVRVEFTGWLASGRLAALFARTDLLVVPSLWPEPSALIGREAGLHGAPQAAFAVGGNGEWLFDGINGYLAPGDPPAAAGLAEAIIKCLREPAEHARLRRGALEVAERFGAERHLNALLEIFEETAGAGAYRAPSPVCTAR